MICVISTLDAVLKHVILYQDFYNLVDVYLDAVFFPKCVEDFRTFQQEGWHYELNDPSEDISYKGCLLVLYRDV